jgi:hypothetical protein
VDQDYEYGELVIRMTSLPDLFLCDARGELPLCNYCQYSSPTDTKLFLTITQYTFRLCDHFDQVMALIRAFSYAQCELLSPPSVKDPVPPSHLR